MGDAKTNYKKSTVVTVLVLLAILTGGTAGFLKTLEHRGNDAVAVSAQVQAATVIRFTAQKNQSVLAQLQDREKVVVEQDSNYGTFVESVNGIKNGADNKYWSYYVNGQIANTGAGDYLTKGGEEIVWKFE